MSFSLLERILDSRRSFLVTVLRTEGHTYKKAGAKALFEVGEDTPRYGNLGSQCVDRDLIEWGRDAVATEMAIRKSIDLSEATDAVFGYGAYCGGKLDVLIEPIGEKEREVYAALKERLEDGLVTGLVHKPDAGTIELELGSSSAIQGYDIVEPTADSIVETWGPSLQVVLFGATPLASVLVPQLRSLDFSTLVIEWRPTYLEKLSGQSPQRLIDRGDFSNTFSRESCVLVLSHVFEQDRDALQAALAKESQFIGMLSSKARREKIFEELSERGVGSDRLEGIRSPLGIDIKGRSDPEIAVSILAELIQFRSEAKRSGTLSN